MDISAFIASLNSWGKSRVPFVFAVDFEMEMPLAWPLEQLDSSRIFFDFNGFSNKLRRTGGTAPSIECSPVSYPDYTRQFDLVMSGLLRGDSFLTNLTINTPVKLDKSLEDLFYLSDARYKFMMKDRFVVFSPETFIQVENDIIRAFPMKGTISADLPDASETILSDAKEKAEHITIVDLLRNDMSIVAGNVHLERFRYVEKVRTNRKSLLQVS